MQLSGRAGDYRASNILFLLQPARTKYIKPLGSFFGFMLTVPQTLGFLLAQRLGWPLVWASILPRHTKASLSTS